MRYLKYNLCLALLVSSVALSTDAVAAAEKFDGAIHMVNPPDVTLYFEALDSNNTTNYAIRAQICWDDPTFTQNCDTPIIANVSPKPTFVCVPGTCHGAQYVIPTGKVGSVTPRDGGHHLMYIKILSETNPGAGDAVVDGSPWPFTFTNGAVDRMWPVNPERSPTRLTAAQLAVFANSQDPYSIGVNGATLCVAGGTPIKDDGVVGYYVKAHAVPCANVRVVSLPVQPYVLESTLDATIFPALKALPSSLQAVALGWVQPAQVTSTAPMHNLQSLSAVVALGAMVVAKTQCAANLISDAPDSPYFNSASSAPFTDYGFRPTMLLAGQKCTGCTPTNNYTGPWVADFQTAKTFIDAAVAGVDSNPNGGKVYWAWTNDTKRNEAAVAVSPLILGSNLSAKVQAQVLGSQANPVPKDISSQNILFYYNGAANWNYLSPTFIPGAGVGLSATSTSGFLPYDTNQTNVASWLNQGAVAAHGDAIEPCKLLISKNPDAAVFISNYVQGQTVVEAFWKSVRNPWVSNFVGDPLAAPFPLATLPGSTADGGAGGTPDGGPGSGSDGGPGGSVATGCNMGGANPPWTTLAIGLCLLALAWRKKAPGKV